MPTPGDNPCNEIPLTSAQQDILTAGRRILNGEWTAEPEQELEIVHDVDEIDRRFIQVVSDVLAENRNVVNELIPNLNHPQGSPAQVVEQAMERQEREIEAINREDQAHDISPIVERNSDDDHIVDEPHANQTGVTVAINDQFVQMLQDPNNAAVQSAVRAGVEYARSLIGQVASTQEQREQAADEAFYARVRQYVAETNARMQREQAEEEALRREHAQLQAQLEAARNVELTRQRIAAAQPNIIQQSINNMTEEDRRRYATYPEDIRNALADSAQPTSTINIETLVAAINRRMTEVGRGYIFPANNITSGKVSVEVVKSREKKKEEKSEVLDDMEMAKPCEQCKEHICVCKSESLQSNISNFIEMYGGPEWDTERVNRSHNDGFQSLPPDVNPGPQLRNRTVVDPRIYQRVDFSPRYRPADRIGVEVRVETEGVLRNPEEEANTVYIDSTSGEDEPTDGSDNPIDVEEEINVSQRVLEIIDRFNRPTQQINTQSYDQNSSNSSR